jgi:hypothetical protein
MLSNLLAFAWIVPPVNKLVKRSIVFEVLTKFQFPRITKSIVLIVSTGEPLGESSIIF